MMPEAGSGLVVILEPEDSGLSRTYQDLDCPVISFTTFAELRGFRPEAPVEILLVEPPLPDAPALAAIEHAMLRWSAITALRMPLYTPVGPLDINCLKALAGELPPSPEFVNKPLVDALLVTFRVESVGQLMTVARRLASGMSQVRLFDEGTPAGVYSRGSARRVDSEGSRRGWLPPTPEHEAEVQPWVRIVGRYHRSTDAAFAVLHIANALHLERNLPLIPAPKDGNLFSEMTLARVLALDILARTTADGMPLAPGELARVLGWDHHSTVDRVVDRLARAGYLRTDEHGRLELTPAGDSFYGKVREALTASVERAKLPVPPDEQECFRAFIGAIVAATARRSRDR